MKTSGETVLICPNCGEDNSPNFRFCGMCGTPLDSHRTAASESPRTGEMPVNTHRDDRAFEQRRGLEDVPPRYARAPQQTYQAPAPQSPAPPRANEPTTISGPSLLGLGSTLDEDTSSSRDNSHEAFSTYRSYYEPDEQRGSVGRVIVLFLLFGGLVVAGWWTYKNYLHAMGSRMRTRSALSTMQDSQSPTGSSQSAGATPGADSSQSPAAAPSQAAQSPAQTQATQPPAASSHPASAQNISVGGAQNAPDTPTPRASPKPPAPQAKTVAKAAPPRSTPARAEKPSPAAAVQETSDSGDAEYKRAADYLYGRGVSENCDEAVKYLKEASAKQNAKARSTFGTMYATGHCVPRDLPASYGWFALALRVDPNNQILEKDLTAVWNQMTPPERQMATRFKP